MTSVSSLMLTTRPMKPPMVEISSPTEMELAHLALLLVALTLRTDQYEIENDDQYNQRKKLCQERTVGSPAAGILSSAMNIAITPPCVMLYRYFYHYIG